MSGVSDNFPVQLATCLPDWSAGGLLRCVVLPVFPRVVSFSKLHHEPDTHDLLRTSSRGCREDATRKLFRWNLSYTYDAAVFGRRRRQVESDRLYGRCGENLECRVRHDLDTDQGLEAICYCRDDETVCGSDDVTYDSQCQLNAAARLKQLPIAVARNGPCNSGRLCTPCIHYTCVSFVSYSLY